eukprot:snap_masked-scaffold_7-processed-gene-16.21-mRNA-1 protein AED:1.00 eAED:1.00 QI:0/-1/0/0/-1/1/1/0/226
MEAEVLALQKLVFQQSNELKKYKKEEKLRNKQRSLRKKKFHEGQISPFEAEYHYSSQMKYEPESRKLREKIHKLASKNNLLKNYCIIFQQEKEFLEKEVRFLKNHVKTLKTGSARCYNCSELEQKLVEEKEKIISLRGEINNEDVDVPISEIQTQLLDLVKECKEQKKNISQLKTRLSSIPTVGYNSSSLASLDLLQTKTSLENLISEFRLQQILIKNMKSSLSSK